MATYEYLAPASRVTQSALTKHWIVDVEDSMRAQGYREYDDALAEAMVRVARELRRQAAVLEQGARIRASDPDLLDV